MGITKRAKSVTVFEKACKSTITSYTCPSCFVSFQGYGPRDNVIRFRCKCGQELIVEERIREGG